MSSGLRWASLGLRVLLEAAIVAGLAYWGYHTGTSPVLRVALAVGAPALGFGFWGAVDFHQAGRLAEPLRLLQELAVSLLAAAAVYTAGQYVAGWALAVVSVTYHALVYAQGGRLVKPLPGHRLEGTLPGRPQRERRVDAEQSGPAPVGSAPRATTIRRPGE